jgi:hypothetical protein
LFTVLTPGVKSPNLTDDMVTKPSEIDDPLPTPVYLPETPKMERGFSMSGREIPSQSKKKENEFPCNKKIIHHLQNRQALHSKPSFKATNKTEGTCTVALVQSHQ